VASQNSVDSLNSEQSKKFDKDYLEFQFRVI